MKDWRWPQFLFMAFYLMNIGVHIAKHGEPKDVNYNFYAAIIATVIEFAVRKAGGLF